MTITDAELRGKMLTVFYDRRHNAQGWVPTSDLEFGVVDRQVIGTVGRQLADAGLIRWKPLVGAQEGFVIGMAQITAFGVDVVEETRPSPINIVLPKSKAPQPPVAEPSEPVKIGEPPPATATEERKVEPEIFTLKPTIYGVGVDLKALFRKVKEKFGAIK